MAGESEIDIYKALQAVLDVVDRLSTSMLLFKPVISQNGEAASFVYQRSHSLLTDHHHLAGLALVSFAVSSPLSIRSWTILTPFSPYLGLLQDYILRPEDDQFSEAKGPRRANLPLPPTSLDSPGSACAAKYFGYFSSFGSNFPWKSRQNSLGQKARAERNTTPLWHLT